MVRVIVALNVPTKPDAHSNQNEVTAQCRAIADAKNRFLKELDGTKHQPIRVFIIVPGMVLNVGADALAILDKSALVSDVRESGADPLTW